MKTKLLLTVAATVGLLLAMAPLPDRQAHAQGDTSEAPVTIQDPHLFSFSTGSPDGALGALSGPAGSEGQETETADDFALTERTVISRATIQGLLVPTGTAVPRVAGVEVEIYHIFPEDSDPDRKPQVPTRTNSPSDHEIDAATRDSGDGTLNFNVTHISAPVTVQKTVINNVINKSGGDGPATGEQVEIDITFNLPLVLPAGHYFFRPEVQVDGGNFLFLSAPKPILPPGTPFPAGVTDLQAWMRNTSLKPDWLRVGADIIVGAPVNMTFSLTGNTFPEGTPGQANCHGQIVSALAQEFGGLSEASTALGVPSVRVLQNEVRAFCEP